MSITQHYINLRTSENIIDMSNNIQILTQNVFDLQSQLQSAYMRIDELTQMIQERHDSHSDD